VEILSPSTRTIDHARKPALYARSGIPFLWLVDPDARAVEALVLQDDRSLLTLTATGGRPVDLPPFPALGLAPDTLWA
jgi:Uma2 family endonuclease